MGSPERLGFAPSQSRLCPDTPARTFALRKSRCIRHNQNELCFCSHWQGLSALCNPTKECPSLWKLRLEVSPPKNHEQEVSLSLHPPLGNTLPPSPLKPFIKYSKTSWQKYHVSTSSRATLAAARRITDAQSNIWLTSTRMMSISAEI